MRIQQDSEVGVYPCIRSVFNSLQCSSHELAAVSLHTRRDICPRRMVLMVERLQDAPITAIQIAQWTRCDSLVARVTRCILEGWPNSVDEEVQPCWMRCLELLTHDWWIVWERKVVIPPTRTRASTSWTPWRTSKNESSSTKSDMVARHGPWHAWKWLTRSVT